MEISSRSSKLPLPCFQAHVDLLGGDKAARSVHMQAVNFDDIFSLRVE